MSFASTDGVERRAAQARDSDEKKAADMLDIMQSVAKGGLPVVAGSTGDASKDIVVAMPPPTAESRARSLRSFAEGVDRKLGVLARGFDVRMWAEDVCSDSGPMAGVFAALDARAQELQRMVDAYIALGDEGVFRTIEPLWGRDRQAWCNVVRTALNKFVHGDLDQMSHLDLILINNAFQASDPDEFDTGDRQLALVFEFLSCALEFKSRERELLRQFQPGQTVTLTGLLRAPHLNGSIGVLQRFDENAGRWEVRCSDGAVRKVKAENLEISQMMG